MKKILAVWVALCTMICLACVATPEQEYVTHKNTEEMLKKAAQTPAAFSDSEQKDLRELYEIPYSFACTESYCEGHFVLTVSADIEVPKSSSLPIVRVEQGRFSQEMIYRLYHYLSKERAFVYKAETQLTKDQIANIVVALEERIQQETDEALIEHLEEQIASYKKQYETAPQTVQEESCDGTFRPIPVYARNGELLCTYTGIDALTRDADEPPAFFCVTNPDPDAASTWVDGQMGLQEAVLSYDDTRIIGQDGESDCLYIGNLDDPTYAQLSFRPREAMEVVRRFWDEVGIYEIQIDSIYWDMNAEQPSYEVVCTRTVQGVPCACLNKITLGNDYSRMWSYETISVFVDQEGIYSLSWEAPLSLKETVVENATLLPFNEVEKLLFTNMERIYGAGIHYKNGDRIYGTTLEEQITIDRITLSLQRINEQNYFDSALLVPAWNFYGESRVIAIESNAEYTETERPRSPFLSINAIDGSIIDPALGY